MNHVETLGNHINGKCLPPASGKYLEDHAPATGQQIALIPRSTEEDVNQAVTAAKKAGPGWAALPK